MQLGNPIRRLPLSMYASGSEFVGYCLSAYGQAKFRSLSRPVICIRAEISASYFQVPTDSADEANKKPLSRKWHSGYVKDKELKANIKTGSRDARMRLVFL